MGEMVIMKSLEVKLEYEIGDWELENVGTGTSFSVVFKAVADLLHLTISIKLIFSWSESLTLMTVFQ